MRKFLLLIQFCISGVLTTNSQSCVPTNINGTIVNLACGQLCTSFTYQVSDLKNTGDYLLTTIPYAPLPYIVASGSEDPNLYDDDTYSTLINLPFTFCFYGANYTSVVVGSNGLMTFDATNAGCANAYTINPPIPNAGGGAQCSQFATYYPKAAIMAAYYDWDPTVSTPNPLPSDPSPPERKIQWRVEGTAPCRKFVVSYYHIGVFGNNCGQTTPSTFQMVIYESTGIIDVFFESKTCVSTTNSGMGILGIQDFTRTLAVAAPGKNATLWSAFNEGYRFTPNSGVSNFISSKLYTIGGTFIADGVTSTPTPGFIDITFPNICPPALPSTQYVIQTIFNSCTGIPLTSSDTVTFNRINSLPATLTTVPTTCGLNIGSITITPTAGIPPYTYILNGGAPQTAPGPYTYLNLAAGPYSVFVTDNTGCDSIYNVNITTTSTIPGSISASQTSCPLSTDATITVTPSGGTAPYTYSLDGGASQASNIFTNVAPGPHVVIFTDAAGCTGTVNITVVAGNTPLTANTSSTPTTCPTLNDGTITVNPTSGTAPYQYRLDGGPPQAGNIFTNVAAGLHTVAVTDIFGCSGSFSINVIQGTGLTSTLNGVDPPCSNINNGTITINPTSGTAPYQYSLNGGPSQPSNIFAGLSPGLYTITITDAAGCTGTNSITLTTNAAITATSTLVSPLCNGVSNGSITLNAAGGVPPYQYSINAGTTYQASPLFGGLAAGNYNFLIKDAAGCIYGFTFTLTQPAVVNASAISGIASCPNNDGSISISASGGTPAYQYSIDNGINYQPGIVFNNLPVGIYNNIKVKDVNGCIAITSAVVTLNDTMRLELGADSTICFGSTITLIPQTNALTDTFKWTPRATLNYDTVRTPVASPTDTTKYYVTAKWGICQRNDSVTINILHKPLVNAGNDTTICYKTNALLVGSASNLSGTVNYSWSPPDSLNTPNAAGTIARIDTTRKFILTVTDNYGCLFSVSDSMWVYMMPPLVVFAGNDTNAIIRRPHQLLASGGTNYVWSPAGLLNNPFIANPMATLINDTYFTVQVTDAIGCTASDGVFIKVYEGPDYYVPNAFSPNGDGLNDIFRPISVGIQRTEYFRVFNRFGELVYQTNQWLQGWDGTYKGKKAALGTYVWMIKGIDRNGKVVEKQGTVILVQ